MVCEEFNDTSLTAMGDKMNAYPVYMFEQSSKKTKLLSDGESPNDDSSDYSFVERNFEAGVPENEQITDVRELLRKLKSDEINRRNRTAAMGESSGGQMRKSIEAIHLQLKASNEFANLKIADDIRYQADEESRDQSQGYENQKVFLRDDSCLVQSAKAYIAARRRAQSESVMDMPFDDKCCNGNLVMSQGRPRAASSSREGQPFSREPFVISQAKLRRHSAIPFHHIAEDLLESQNHFIHNANRPQLQSYPTGSAPQFQPSYIRHQQVPLQRPRIHPGLLHVSRRMSEPAPGPPCRALNQFQQSSVQLHNKQVLLRQQGSPQFQFSPPQMPGQIHYQPSLSVLQQSRPPFQSGVHQIPPEHSQFHSVSSRFYQGQTQFQAGLTPLQPRPPLFKPGNQHSLRGPPFRSNVTQPSPAQFQRGPIHYPPNQLHLQPCNPQQSSATTRFPHQPNFSSLQPDQYRQQHSSISANQPFRPRQGYLSTPQNSLAPQSCSAQQQSTFQTRSSPFVHMGSRGPTSSDETRFPFPPLMPPTSVEQSSNVVHMLPTESKGLPKHHRRSNPSNHVIEREPIMHELDAAYKATCSEAVQQPSLDTRSYYGLGQPAFSSDEQLCPRDSVQEKEQERKEFQFQYSGVHSNVNFPEERIISCESGISTSKYQLALASLSKKQTLYERRIKSSSKSKNTESSHSSGARNLTSAPRASTPKLLSQIPDLQFNCDSTPSENGEISLEKSNNENVDNAEHSPLENLLNRSVKERFLKIPNITTKYSGHRTKGPKADFSQSRAKYFNYSTFVSTIEDVYDKHSFQQWLTCMPKSPGIYPPDDVWSLKMIDFQAHVPHHGCCNDSKHEV